MIELIKKIDEVIKSCRFYGEEYGYIPAIEFQEQFIKNEGADWFNCLFMFKNLRLLWNPVFAAEISYLIVREFGQFIDTKNGTLAPIDSEIGLGYRFFDPGKSISEVNSFKVRMFADDIVGASVVFGLERVEKLLEKWKNPEPLTFFEKSKIFGIHVKESTKIATGMCILPAHDKSFDQDLFLEYNFRNTPIRANLEECSTLVEEIKCPPALYPAKDKINFTKELMQFQSIDFRSEYYCDLLSLVSKEYVGKIFTWYDFGLELNAFPIALRSRFLIDENFATETKNLTSEMVDQMKTFDNGWCKISCKQPEKCTAFDISVTKWIDSIRTYKNHSLDVRCVDMRTALEGLFLFYEEKAKIAKKISSRCSKILGGSTCEQTERYQTLNALYNLSSKIVHASFGIEERLMEAYQLLIIFKHLERLPDEDEEFIQKKESTIQIKRKLLERVQGIYSEAIEFILMRGEIPDWKKLGD